MLQAWPWGVRGEEEKEEAAEAVWQLLRDCRRMTAALRAALVCV